MAAGVTTVPAGEAASCVAAGVAVMVAAEPVSDASSGRRIPMYESLRLLPVSVASAVSGGRSPVYESLRLPASDV